MPIKITKSAKIIDELVSSISVDGLEDGYINILQDNDCIRINVNDIDALHKLLCIGVGLEEIA